MTLQELVGEFIARRQSGGLFLGDPEVMACGIEAVRRYLAWGSLEGAPALRLQDVAADTPVSPGEWGVIGPLFYLYAERESALRVESSRGLGVDVPGRSSAEVEGDIRALESELPRLAFTEDAFTVGMS